VASSFWGLPPKTIPSDAVEAVSSERARRFSGLPVIARPITPLRQWETARD
jgi:hypothetical protein